MSSIQDIAEQLRACNAEHVRAIIEPDDVMVLVDYLDRQSQLVVQERAEPKSEPVSLESMTKDELLEYADSHGVEVAKSKTKAEIIEAIESESK